MLNEQDTADADQQELREFLALQQGEAVVTAKRQFCHLLALPLYYSRQSPSGIADTMVALLKILASRLSLLLLLSTVLGIMATPLPIYEMASQLERRSYNVELHLRNGHFLPSRKFSASRNTGIVQIKNSDTTYEYLMIFGTTKGLKVTRTDTVETGPTSPKWKLERVLYSNKNRGIFLGTLIFAKREYQQEVLGKVNSDGKLFDQTFEGENAAQVFNRVLEWFKKNSRITYEADPANPNVWENIYANMITLQ
ncbi:hypothetical protein F5876DRAFT_79794 [Lentinula aff. lateritia]|uniref:Uncharacterized protein n=1 Tax=Lentinula aff. lateritia TaxID=2804960 RepID=A0ACC1TSJ0_9AGAR|nr:hypothetical protein F5876DRAFT_79794 [Lentinula aff. lateritia]